MPSERSIERAGRIWCEKKHEHKEFDADLALSVAELLDEQVRKDAGIAHNNNDSCNCTNCNKRFNIEQAIISQLQPKKGEKV